MKQGYVYFKVGIFFLCAMISSTFTFSQISNIQIFQEWASNDGLTDHAYKASSAYDNTGALYVVGGTISSNGDWDWLITKFDANTGYKVWSVAYDAGGSTQNDFLADIAIDSDCNLFVVGAKTSDSTSSGYDLGVAMFDSSGAFQWIGSYDNGQSYPYSNDGGSSIVLYGGYVYVTGSSQNSSYMGDFLTLQYTVAGDIQWTQLYDYGGYDDIGVNIHMDKDEPVITGYVQRSLYYGGGYAVKYAVDGSLDATTSVSPMVSDTMTEVHDVAVHPNGDIYITGYIYDAYTDRNAKIIKLDSNLNVQWEFTSNFLENDEGNFIRSDSAGHVFVGGYKTTSGNTDYLIAQLDTAGNVTWGPVTYNGSGNALDVAESAVVDSEGNLIVTGYSWTDHVNFDYNTVKYDTAGALVWQIYYNGIADKDDRAYEISINENDEVSVVGQSQDGTGVTSTWITVKYHEHLVYNIPDADTTAPNIDLVSNYGQLISTDSTVNENIKMYDWQGHTFYQSNRIIEVIGGVDTSAVTTDTIVRIDIVLHNDSSRNVFPLNKQQNYFNYYTMLTPSGGINRVPSYQKAYYPVAYKGIDIYSTKNGWGPIHQFVVRPNEAAVPSDIEFTIEGADTFYLNAGKLVIVHALDTMIYGVPKCSQVDSSGGYVAPTVASVYTLTGGVISFTNGTWASANLPIIIEMNQGGPFLLGGGPPYNVNWSTYYGGQGADEINDGYIAPGDTLLHVCGYSSSQFVPATVGALQFNFSPGPPGFTDAIIGKFKANGQRLFVTHFGGASSDRANGITYDALGNIYVVGNTSSSSIIHIMPGVYDNTYQGGSNDGLIISLQPNGQLNWATYFGGSGNDIFNSISLDPSNPTNFAIVGYSSSSNFPLDSSGVSGTPYCVPCNGSAASTGVIVKIDTSGFPGWSTCFGGTTTSEEQELNDVAIANNGDIYLTGYSSGAILAQPNSQPGGAYIDSTYAGAFDREALIAKFDSSCTFIWSTYYGGAGRDEGKSITLTDSGEVFVGGLTGSFDFDAHSYGTAYFDSYRGDWDWFFLKFNTNLGRDWATTYGSDAYDQLNDIHYANGWIYATGYIYSNSIPSLFPIAGNPVGTLNDHTTFDVGTDGGTAMVVALDPSLILRWATCIPGIDADEGKRVVTDNAEQLYLLTTATSAIWFPLWYDGVAYFNYHHSDSINNGSNIVPDGAITRFDLPLITILNVEEVTEHDNFLLYPNPTTGIVNFKVENGYDALIVYDLMGKVVYLGTETKETTLQSIDLSNLQSGIYIITLTKGLNRKTGKIIVSH